MPDLPQKFEEAVRLLRAGQLEEGERVGLELLAAAPRNPAILDLLGMIARFRGRHEESLDRFTAALAERESSTFHLHRGLALRAVGRRDEEAIEAFRSAVRLQPDDAEAYQQLGNALKSCGRWHEAREALERAVKLAPEDALGWLNLGVTVLELGKAGPAVLALERAVAIEPGRPEAWNILGAALQKNGDLTGAQAALRRAIALRGDYAPAHDNLAMVCKSLGDISQAIAEFRAALAITANPETQSNLVYALNFSPDVRPEAVFAEHKAWNDAYAVRLPAEDRPARSTAADGRLKVGFVSADFVDHAVAYFFEPYLRARDRQRFHITCYANVAVPDAVTERLRALADHWVDVAKMSDAELSRRIAADGIDILVDLAGHTAGNRLLALARRPAPIQVTWLGYPNTTGLTAIDYRITDAISDPPGRTEKWHSERLVRLPDLFLCYGPPEVAPQTGPVHPPEAPVVFASFSNFAKLSDPCLELWARVLERVPGSQLILKARGLGDAAAARRVRDAFNRHQVDAKRIELIGTLCGTAEHLALYHRVDIALDPFPYNGTTSTCEALWMGVPVVTLAGETHVQRVGASILQTVGHPEWVAATVDEYAVRAIDLARNVVGLRTGKAVLREVVGRSPLCDAKRFAGHLEAAFCALMNSSR